MIYRMKIWTGPTLVQQLAEKAREAGLQEVRAGTEHIYVVVAAMSRDWAAWNVCAALRSRHGTDYGLRPQVQREFDDISSAVRALLTGYDEA